MVCLLRLEDKFPEEPQNWQSINAQSTMRLPPGFTGPGLDHGMGDEPEPVISAQPSQRFTFTTCHSQHTPLSL